MFTLGGATSGNRGLISKSNFRLFRNVYHTLRFHLSEDWPRVRNRKAKDRNDDHTASDYQRDSPGKGYSQHSHPFKPNKQPLIMNQRPIIPITQLINPIRTPNQNQHYRQTQNPNQHLKPLLTLLTENFLESGKG